MGAKWPAMLSMGAATPAKPLSRRGLTDSYHLKTDGGGVHARRPANSPAESLAGAAGKAMSVVTPSLAGQSASVGAASLAAGDGAAGALGNLGPLLRRRTGELAAALEQRAISDFNDWLVPNPLGNKTQRETVKSIGLRA